jgi:hypothetical protein
MNKTFKNPKNTKSYIMKHYGLTDDEYRKQNDVMRKRVKNYNLTMGTEYSAIERFRFSLEKEHYSLTREILQQSTYRTKALKQATKQSKSSDPEQVAISINIIAQARLNKVLRDYEGLLSKSKTAQKILSDWEKSKNPLTFEKEEDLKQQLHAFTPGLK